MQVKKLMMPNPQHIFCNQTLREAADIYISCQVNCTPVLNDHQKIVGILTVSDVLKALYNGAGMDTPVKDVMSTELLTIDEDTNFEDVICSTSVERLLVLNREQKLIGILSRIELIKKVFETLQETRNDLSMILEAVHNAIIAIDRKGIIRLYNPAAERIIGVPRVEALGQPIEKIIPNTKLLDVLHEEKSNFGQKWTIHDTVVVANRSPVYYKGELIGAVSVFQDISELEAVQQQLDQVRELNAELKSIIETSYDGILVVDLDGKILRGNSGCEKILGVGLCQNIQRISALSGNIKDVLQSIINNSINRRCSVTVTHTTDDGKEILITGTPDFNEGVEIARIIINIRDMTELNILQEEVQRSKDETARVAEELKELRAKQLEVEGVISKSTEMRQIMELACTVARVDSTVLITGESGAGKEVVAKIIHQASKRQEGPFIKVNCGAIPENLLESELFGYEKGAFTGANKEGKMGLIEVANNGTLLLDEIGDLPLNLQVKLLRAIQERVIYRIGGVKPITLNVRFIAATNKDLLAMSKEGKFREDLYYRLNVVPIHIPPLRKRKADILPLTLHFLAKFNKLYNLNKQIFPEVFRHLEEYDWPGNVRELENIIERALVMYLGPMVLPEHLPGSLLGTGKAAKVEVRVKEIIQLKEAGEIVERELIAKAMESYRSSRKAAEALGVTHTTILRKLKQFNLG